MRPAERYDDLLLLADLFDDTGREMRDRAALGERALRDAGLADSAELAPATFERFEEDVRAVTTGEHGLLARSVELDADAVAVRATVATYRWIDDLRAAADRTLGAIAGRAVGYLAPQVALGGAIVSAGLIETDALERDDVAAHLEELVAENPELLDHVTGADGLLASLRLRSLLKVATLPEAAARAGLEEVSGGDPFRAELGAGVRDIAGPVLVPVLGDGPAAGTATGRRPPFAGLGDLLATLAATRTGVAVHEVAPGRLVVLLPGCRPGSEQVRLVGGDPTAYADQAAAAIDGLVGAAGVGAHVVLVGFGRGGSAALDVAGRADGSWTVDLVVTAGAPSALVPPVPRGVRVLSLEDRADPVARLGSLVNAGADDHLTVVFGGDGETGPAAYAAGGRAVDGTDHPLLRAELDRLRALGYLA